MTQEQEPHPVLTGLSLMWRALWPLVSVALTVPLALMPRLQGHDAYSPAALLPLLVMHYWTVHTGRGTPALLAFGAGLALDVFSHGPLGYWALINLTAARLSAATASFSNQGPMSHGLGLAGCLLALAGFQWLLGLAATFQPPNPIAILEAASIAALFYPALAAVLYVTSPAPGPAPANVHASRRWP